MKKIILLLLLIFSVFLTTNVSAYSINHIAWSDASQEDAGVLTGPKSFDYSVFSMTDDYPVHVTLYTYSSETGVNYLYHDQIILNDASFDDVVSGSITIDPDDYANGNYMIALSSYDTTYDTNGIQRLYFTINHQDNTEHTLNLNLPSLVLNTSSTSIDLADYVEYNVGNNPGDLNDLIFTVSGSCQNVLTYSLQGHVLTLSRVNSGSCVLHIGVSDGVVSDFDQLHINVLNNNINHAPVFSGIIDNISVDFGVPLSDIVLSDFFSDVDGDVLSYGLVHVGGDNVVSGVVINGGLRFSYVGVGSDSFYVVANDGTYSVSSNIFTVTILDSGSVDAVDDYFNVLHGNTQVLDVLGNDVGVNLALINVSSSSLNNRVEIVDNKLLYSADNVGVDNFDYTVSDGVFTSVGHVTVDVQEHYSILSVFVPDLNVNSFVSLDLYNYTVYDNDGNHDYSNLRYALVNNSCDGVANLNVYDHYLNINPVANGDCYFRLSVDAAEFHNVSNLVHLVVSVDGHAPVFSGIIDNISVDFGVPLSDIVLSDFFSDVDGDVLSYGLVHVGGDNVVSGVVINDYLRFSYVGVGSDSFYVVANDGTYSVSSNIFTVTILDSGSVDAVDDYYTATLGDELNLDVLSNDVGVNLALINVSSSSLGNTVSIVNNKIIFKADVAGMDYFDYVISDGIFTDSARVYINVSLPNSNVHAYFSAPSIVLVNTPVRFDASNSFGEDLTYYWNFGDGIQPQPVLVNNPVIKPVNKASIFKKLSSSVIKLFKRLISNEPVSSKSLNRADAIFYHTYTKPGIYNVVLRVVDKYGNFDIYSKTINVINQNNNDDDNDNVVVFNGDAEKGVRFSRISVPYIVDKGQRVHLSVDVMNSNDFKVDSLRLSILIPDLGLKLKSHKFNLDANEHESVSLDFDVPFDSFDGECPIKISVANDDIIHSKWWFINIE